jgi:ubiquinone/menaquinone biosynthesis C-methylase UbiE
MSNPLPARPEPKGNQAAIERANAFDQLAARYASVYDFAIMFLPLWGSRLVKAIPHIKGPRVLEVSFGTGFLMSQYANRFDTTGLDYSAHMMEATRQRLARRGLSAKLVQGDAHAMPFADNSFDCLINSDAFTLYADPVKAMSEFYRVLAPGGRLILLEYNYPKQKSWMGDRIMILPKLLGMPFRDFDALLSGAGFKYEDVPVGLAGMLHMYLGTK